MKKWSSGGTGTATRLIEITGTATDADLSSVFVNQTEASLNTQTFTAEVLFAVGTNIITAVATDDAGNTSQSQIECYYRPNLASLVEYAYDDNGCLIRKVVDSTYYTVYDYDYENRLVEVTLPDSSTNEFVYDGDKRRISRKDASGDEKWFLYDGVNILQDVATDGTVWTSYVQGIGIDKLISVSEWAGQTTPTTRYYHSDAIGSVRSLTDDNEAEVKTYEYDAWGKVTVETGTDGNEYKYTSRRWEEDLGLQYNRARFYDPETGRFITPDPLTGGPDDPSISYFSGIYSAFHRFIKEHIDALQPDKHNRYIYCYNNPINLIDPLGLESGGETKIEKDSSEKSDEEKNGDTKVETAGATGATGTEQKGKTAKDVTNGTQQKNLIGKIADAVGISRLWESITSPKTEQEKIKELKGLLNNPEIKTHYYNPENDPKESIYPEGYVYPWREHMRIQQAPSSLSRVTRGADAGLTAMAEGPEKLPAEVAAIGGALGGLAETIGSKRGEFTTVVDYNANSKATPWSAPTQYRYSTYGYKKIETERHTDGAKIVTWERDYKEKKEANKILGIKQ